ncbi:MAG: hypothetical protein H0U06_07605 [Solirubrobacterales bacterium]|nr:hypothetical protein [Solirubrobacterales bacterium]
MESAVTVGACVGAGGAWAIVCTGEAEGDGVGVMGGWVAWGAAVCVAAAGAGVLVASWAAALAPSAAA